MFQNSGAKINACQSEGKLWQSTGFFEKEQKSHPDRLHWTLTDCVCALKFSQLMRMFCVSSSLRPAPVQRRAKEASLAPGSIVMDIHVDNLQLMQPVSKPVYSQSPKVHFFNQCSILSAFLSLHSPREMSTPILQCFLCPSHWVQLGRLTLLQFWRQLFRGKTGRPAVWSTAEMNRAEWLLLYLLFFCSLFVSLHAH